MRVLLIDNYDSFTYNLVQLIGGIDKNISIDVYRNDELDLATLTLPDAIVISPGPGNPLNHEDFGVCTSILSTLSKTISTLGVCLGHQGIGAEFGFKIVPAKEIRHGKCSEIIHTSSRLFLDIPQKFRGARYHSLVIKPVDPQLTITAQSTDDNAIMAVEHKKFPIYGVQFHPESILTEHGEQLMKNFLQIALENIQMQTYKIRNEN